MKKLYLVDVSSLFFRAFYAIPYMKTKQGLPTNALYGFLSMSLKLLRDVKPDYMVYCQDRKEPSFRRDLYKEYKANRSEMPEDLVPQMPYIQQLTDIMGIPNINKLGYEADDVIGSLTKFGKSQGLEVVIVSGDKDFAQLIDDNVSMYDTMKNVKYNVQGAIDKWGVGPEQFIDYLALIGDSSDNIPGVKGIGPKGAQKLLSQFKTLDGIYENIEQVSAKAMKAKLIENKEMAYLSKKLVTIVDDLDLIKNTEGLKLQPVDREGLHGLLTDLEFKSFEKKFFVNNNGLNHTGEKTPESDVNIPVSETKTEVQVEVKKSNPELSKGVKKWSISDFQKNIEPYSELWAIESERGLIFNYKKEIITLDDDPQGLGEVLGKKYVKWKGFDLKSTWRSLNVSNPIAAWDQMLAAYIIKPKNVGDFSKVYEQFTGGVVPDLANEEQLVKCHLTLAHELQVKIEQVNGLSVLNDIELPLVPVLYNMEKSGVSVDSPELERQSKELKYELEQLEIEIHNLAGEPFNIASPKQLASILFEKLKLPPGKKTKTGFSTNSDVLQKLALENPICEYILSFRENAKLKSTYVDSLTKLVNPSTGKVHTTFKQAVTTTGRLSSINPNLQNIPIRTEKGRLVRKAFIASRGCKLLSLDYSQIELRVLAHITGDRGLIEAFERGQDVHASTASEIYSVRLEDVTPEQRRHAKAVNFGIAYGQGVYGLAETLKISRSEAKDIIERYFKKFSKVKDYMKTVVGEAKEKGYVEMLSGRRRYLDELQSKNAMIRSFGERAAINAPMQGTASDIVKMAMIQVSESVGAPMVLQVHDELLFDLPEADLSQTAEEVKKIMEGAMKLNVPLVANVGFGDNWLEAH